MFDNPLQLVGFTSSRRLLWRSFDDLDLGDIDKSRQECVVGISKRVGSVGHSLCHGVVSDVWWCELVCALRVQNCNSRTDCDRFCDEAFALTESQVLSFMNQLESLLQLHQNIIIELFLLFLPWSIVFLIRGLSGSVEHDGER